jgi:alkanesulfonate monooxygenase SsuD/methylene tetrahydromethanopterin reductase-like flavin-dependent oxidoreductase (luciferase family)
MDFGIFDHVEKRGDDFGEIYRDRLRVAEAADRAGFYCYHIAEHQGTPLSMAPSPNLLLAALAIRTHSLRFGPLCYILPLYDPLRLINEICMLDNLSGGRLDIGVGRGVSPIELGFFKIDPRESRAIFQETLDIVREGLRSTSLTYHGQYHDYDDVPIELSPYQKPSPPFWYPTSGLPSVPWVAENKFHTVFLGAPDHVADQVKLYEKHLAGTDERERMKIGILRYVFVAETDAEATRVAEPAYAAHLQHLHHLAKLRGSTARSAVPDTAGAREGNPATVGDAVRRGWAAVGSPETVAEQLHAMQETSNCNYIIFNPLLGDIDGDRGVAAIELFGEQVMTKFRV